jgi:CelD/BcsL family acetyltransferase involved in cellulose biosynthesis
LITGDPLALCSAVGAGAFVYNVVTSGARLVVEVIRDLAVWEALEAEWRELFAASPAASPPLSWEWLHGWWLQYGGAYAAHSDSLRIVTVRRNGTLVGALPLYIARSPIPLVGVRRLRFLSTGEDEAEETCAEYLDLLSLPEESSSCVAAIQALLARERSGWDELLLQAVSEDSPLTSVAQSLSASQLMAAVIHERTCHVADLTGGLEAYLQRLSAHQRKKLRRLLRAVASENASFDLATDVENADAFYEQLISLHQLRWSTAGKLGCFASVRFTEFHRALCRRLVPDGSAILARLSVAGQPVGVIYGFVVGSRFHFYQCGLTNTPIGAIESPGTAAHLMLMSHLAEKGIFLYDFLGGSSEYKERLATLEHRLMRISARNSNARATLLRLSAPLIKALGKDRS